MNALLNNAEKWFTDLGIKTIARPFCLMVSKDDVVNLVGVDDPYRTILAEVVCLKQYEPEIRARNFRGSDIKKLSRTITHEEKFLLRNASA